MNKKYTLVSRNDDMTPRYISSDEIVKAFKDNALPMPEMLTGLLTNGCRYSYEDFDVLSGSVYKLRSNGISI